MSNKSKRASYKFKALSGGNDHLEKVEQCFVESFKKGYSVVQITRIAGMRSAKYVHAALVKRGCVGKGKPGRQSGKIDLPEGFVAVLKIRGLSFAQWCAGWAFEPTEIAAELENPSPGLQGALTRDFPSYYSKLTGIKVEEIAVGDEFESYEFDAHFGWDGALGCYTCEISELGIKTYGDSWSYAFYLARMQRKDLMAIQRLEQAPSLKNVKEGEFDW